METLANIAIVAFLLIGVAYSLRTVMCLRRSREDTRWIPMPGRSLRDRTRRTYPQQGASRWSQGYREPASLNDYLSYAFKWVKDFFEN